MPTYEFQCQGCEHREEKFLSIKSNPAQKLVCPACGKRSLKRLISAGAGFKMERGEFPYIDWTLPRLTPEEIKQNGVKIHSRAELRDIAAGKRNGQRYEINQV